jgi:hypothetical protein
MPRASSMLATTWCVSRMISMPIWLFILILVTVFALGGAGTVGFIVWYTNRIP